MGRSNVGLGQISKVAKNKVKFMYSTFFNLRNYIMSLETQTQRVS